MKRRFTNEPEAQALRQAAREWATAPIVSPDFGANVDRRLQEAACKLAGLARKRGYLDRAAMSGKARSHLMVSGEHLARVLGLPVDAIITGTAYQARGYVVRIEFASRGEAAQVPEVGESCEWTVSHS